MAALCFTSPVFMSGDDSADLALVDHVEYPQDDGRTPSPRTHNLYVKRVAIIRQKLTLASEHQPEQEGAEG